MLVVVVIIIIVTVIIIIVTITIIVIIKKKQPLHLGRVIAGVPACTEPSLLVIDGVWWPQGASGCLGRVRNGVPITVTASCRTGRRGEVQL